MTNMQGRVALVTGGTSGIGRMTAIEFGRHGASVVVVGRREPEGQETVELVKAAGGEAVFFRGDLTSEDDCRGMVELAVEKFGRLDFAFNNAGTEAGGPITEVTAEDYHRCFDLNVLGVLLSMKYEIRAMLQSGGGAIVNTSSVLGSVGIAGASVYVASKHAVIGLSRAAALEYAQQQIRVNILSPAVVPTELFQRFTGGQAEMIEGMRAMHPVGRFGKPEEMAAAVIYLCSDEAAFVTGHDLRVDGGFSVP